MTSAVKARELVSLHDLVSLAAEKALADTKEQLKALRRRWAFSDTSTSPPTRETGRLLSILPSLVALYTK